VFARAARMATLLVGLWVIGRIWRIDLLATRGAERDSRRAPRPHRHITILLTLIAADLVWALFRSML
jgi:hypothetical protein